VARAGQTSSGRDESSGKHDFANKEKEKKFGWWEKKKGQKHVFGKGGNGKNMHCDAYIGLI